MAFIDQVQDLTSLTVSDNDELSQFLRDGAIDVTNRWLIVRPQDIEQFQRESAIIDSNSGLDLVGATIISVMREAGADGSSDGSTSWRDCRKVPASLQSRVVDTESLYFASVYNPVYIIDDNGKVNVYPVASSNNGYRAFYVNNSPEESDGSALRYTSTSIKYFPADKVYLVVMYAGIRSLHAAMGATTITDLTVTVVPPDVPLLASTSISFSQVAPTYTSPTTTISGTAWATAYPDQYSAVTTAWTAINTELDETQAICDLINTQTDSAVAELAESATQVDASIDTALAAILTAVGRVDTAVQLANVQFDSAVTQTAAEDVELAASYTSAGQGFLGEAQGSLGEAQGYVNEVNSRIAQVGGYGTVASGYINAANTFANELKSKISIAQGYATEVQSRLSNVQPKVSEYQSKVQDALHEFNEANAAYKAQLQISIQNAQLENQDEQFKIQKYQAEYAGYTAEVNEQVQAYTQNLQADGVGYQWLQDQYTRLKAEYDAAFMIAAPKPQQQVRR